MRDRKGEIRKCEIGKGETGKFDMVKGEIGICKMGTG